MRIGLEEPDSVEITFGEKECVKVRFLGRAHEFVQKVIKAKESLSTSVTEVKEKRSELRKNV